jgi:hypothetical protein
MSGNEDYDLDWATFDADIQESDTVKASSISTIQTNMDLIKNNLDNITHDSSHLGDNRATHYTEHNTSHDDQQKTTEYTDHDTIQNTGDEITHYTDHRTSQRTTHYTSRLSTNNDSNFNNYRVGVDVDYDANQNTDHYTQETATEPCETHHSAQNNEVYYSQYSAVNMVMVDLNG